MDNLKNFKCRLFDYNYQNGGAEPKISGFIVRPDKLNSCEQIKLHDETAERIIKECKNLIADLEDYRQDLQIRYNELETMSYTDSVKLQRRRDYDNRISYYILFYRTYSDGTEVKTSTEYFTGRERNKAIARFNQIKKDLPNLPAVMDIEKKGWER